MRRLTGALALLTLACFTGASAKEAAPGFILKKGQRVAVVGDSITEQKLYSKYIELYLTACMPDLELHVIQLGWGGETAPGFAARMNNDLLPWKPDVVTTCYGMNDGGYRAYQEDIGKRYFLAMADIVARLKKAGAVVVVGGPGVVDSKYFQGDVFVMFKFIHIHQIRRFIANLHHQARICAGARQRSKRADRQVGMMPGAALRGSRCGSHAPQGPRAFLTERFSAVRNALDRPRLALAWGRCATFHSAAVRARSRQSRLAVSQHSSRKAI